MPDEKATTKTRAKATDGKEQRQDDEKSKGSDDAAATAGPEAQVDGEEELKIVVSIKGGRGTVGVQRPSSDPHIESFDDADLTRLAQEVAAVAERAKTRWEETPKHPAYERPIPPARGRNRRQQGAAQEEEQAPRLF